MHQDGAVTPRAALPRGERVRAAVATAQAVRVAARTGVAARSPERVAAVPDQVGPPAQAVRAETAWVIRHCTATTQPTAEQDRLVAAVRAERPARQARAATAWVIRHCMATTPLAGRVARATGGVLARAPGQADKLGRADKVLPAQREPTARVLVRTGVVPALAEVQ